MAREEVKSSMIVLIKKLKSMAEEYEELLSEMDNLSDDEFNEKAEKIENLYSNYGIELF